MNCQNDDCKKPFTHGQVVYVVLDDENIPVPCCCKACADTIKAKLKQTQVFERIDKMTYLSDDITQPGCWIGDVSIKNGKDGNKIVTKILLPGMVSVDKLRDYMFQPVSMTISRPEFQFDPVVQTSCHLEAVGVRVVKGEIKIVAKIAMPETAPIDSIKDYMDEGETTLTISRGYFESVPETV